MKQTIKVWDPLLRLFHWSLVISFAGAFLLGEDNGDGALHHLFGYIAAGLIAFRLVWGVIGSRYARFGNFIPSISRVWPYLKDMAAGREQHYVGHNPAGALMIVALLLAVAGTAASGWLMTTPGYGEVEWVEEMHELLSHGTLVLIGLHVAGVFVTSVRQRENLVRAMITGRKRER